MTLNDWQRRYRYQGLVHDYPTGAKWVVLRPEDHEARAFLYTLTDYIVSSVAAGTHWLYQNPKGNNQQVIYTLDTALDLLDRQSLEQGQVVYLVGWDTRLGALTQLRNAATGQAKSFGTFNNTAIAMKYMDAAAKQLNCQAYVVQWDNRFGTRLVHLPPKPLPSHSPTHQLEVRVNPDLGYFAVRIFNRKTEKEVTGLTGGNHRDRDEASKKAQELSDLLNAPVLWM